jgi:hypothetical protein
MLTKLHQFNLNQLAILINFVNNFIYSQYLKYNNVRISLSLSIDIIIYYN